MFMIVFVNIVVFHLYHYKGVVVENLSWVYRVEDALESQFMYCHILVLLFDPHTPIVLELLINPLGTEATAFLGVHRGKLLTWGMYLLIVSSTIFIQICIKQKRRELRRHLRHPYSFWWTKVWSQYSSG